MPLHGNANQSKRLQHLYEIRDKQENNTFKYGISSESIEEDGLSKRIRTQVTILNLAIGWRRFYGNILIREIKGRLKAKEIERQYIEAHLEKYEEKPRGNQQ